MLRLLHQEGFVGEIREVRVTGMELAPPKETYEWARDPDVVGVHAMNLGMWVEVLNRWVGPATRVTATGTIHHRKRKTYEGDWVDAAVPDSLAVVADLECGATASYHLSTGAAGGPGSCIEIYGSRGALAYQLFVEEIRGASGAGAGWQPIPIPAEEAGSQTIDTDFVQAIRTGSPVSPDFVEGLGYMKFCEAVALSMKTGSLVSIAGLEPRMHSWGRWLD
jgi:predicted dehydrogenase